MTARRFGERVRAGLHFLLSEGRASQMDCHARASDFGLKFSSVG